MRSDESRARDAARKQEELYALAIPTLRQDGRFEAIEVKHGGPKRRRSATSVEVLEALSPFYSGAWLAGDANSLLLAGHGFHNDVQHKPFDDVLLSFVRRLQSLQSAR